MQIANNAQCKSINNKNTNDTKNSTDSAVGKKVSFEDILKDINKTYKNDSEKASDVFMFLGLIPNALAEYEKSKGCKQEVTESDLFSVAIESLQYSINNNINHSQEKKERLNIVLKELVDYSSKYNK